MNRILWNQRPPETRVAPGSIDSAGNIDEVVLQAERIHIEQMHDRCWWIAVDVPGGGQWMGNFCCDSRGRMRFTEQEMDGFEWDRDDTHETASDD